ncbi:hypothetical protein Sfum_0089 [Syntrophobacter fumaroxidans MPOB]|uniref:Uncharacterized protein n=1 Tax=Syntrophobacter fumaroxidans (strain DSM 10017 / MPOB) TaxID=335543 RepID=A0LEE0_SYNFM|nr:hypothetical protein Sfum_0089 [Syntrophobacter fumaroxidans MPOB]
MNNARQRQKRRNRNRRVRKIAVRSWSALLKRAPGKGLRPTGKDRPVEELKDDGCRVGLRAGPDRLPSHLGILLGYEKTRDIDHPGFFMRPELRPMFQ